MTSMRTKGKSTVVWLLMGMVLLGLGGFGMHNFSGGIGSDSIGQVGSTPVRADSYVRALQSEINTMSQQSGQHINAETARLMGIPQMVQQRLFTAAALEDAANRMGVSVGDAEVARQLRGSAAFRGPNGQFDRAVYADMLRREGLTEARFEHDVRMDAVRMMLERAVTGGVAAQASVVDRSTGWLMQRRDVGWQELTAADLTQPIAEPDEAALRSWHEANAAKFTAPEKRSITYVWVTPDMLADSVQLDEKALRDLYQQQIDQFQQPERRSVRRLVFQDPAAASDARARIDRGETTFDALVAERGLTDADIDMGEMTKAALGAAGDAVFALDHAGVAGPVDTDLGPALFAMDAILEPVNTTFEEAAPELRAEAAADAARRQIEAETSKWEDLIAGGASFEDLVKETPLKLGQIDWSADMTPPDGSIAGYTAFRTHAARLGEKDFPELFQLEDGGVFALRLDKVTPPTLIPFEEVKDKVAADWRAMETSRQLQALAEERRLALIAAAIPPAPPMGQPAPAAAASPPTAEPAPTPGAPAPAPAAPAIASATAPVLAVASGLTRDGAIPDVPPAVVSKAFEIAEPGDAEVVVADDRVFLIRLDAITQADMAAPDVAMVRSGVAARLNDSLRADLFGYYAYALQQQGKATVNPTALAAADARVQ